MAIVLALLGYLLFSGRSKMIAGREVKKVTRWQDISLILPIPYRVWEVYYAYTDEKGNLVKHGPYQSFDRRGKPDTEAFYRDGKLDGTETTWTSSGTKSQTFWRMGQQIGSADFENDHMVYAVQHIYENDVKVGVKEYKNGRWTLAFYCGNKIDRDVDPATGQEIELAAPWAISCQ